MPKTAIIVMSLCLLFVPAALADTPPVPAPAAASADVKADVAAPTTPETPAVDENPGEYVEKIIDAYSNKDWGILAGLSIMLLIWIVKRFVWTSLPVSALPWVSIGLGVLVAVATALMAGQLWWKAILNGLTTGAAASGLWSAVGKHVFGSNAK
jgi:hypothetical protein